MRGFKAWIVGVCFACHLVSASAATPDFDGLMQQALQAEINNFESAEDLQPDSPRYLTHALAQFYQQRDYRPVWTSTSLSQLISNIPSLSADGLNPQDYGLSRLKIAQQIVAMRNADAVNLRMNDELLATGVYFTAIFHLYFGKIDKDGEQAQWQFNLSLLTDVLGSEFLSSIESAKIDAIFQKARPSHQLYQAMQKGLLDYRQYAANGGWPIIPEGLTLKPCDIDSRVAILRQRLRVTGEYVDLPITENVREKTNLLEECRKKFPTAITSVLNLLSDSDSTHELDNNLDNAIFEFNAEELFDPQLVDAVKQFQSEQYLDIDASVGASTRAALNISVEDRVNQIRVNLDRARSLFRQISSDIVLVDVAGFKLTYYRDSQPVWKTRVQVGQAYRTTPTFRSEIHYLTLNPGWTIPPTILRKDVLPKVRKNVNYLQEHSIRVYDITNKEIDASKINWSAPGGINLRQDYVTDGALGKAVIRFPNPYSIYLHDTPYQRLFKKSQRAFSSGCIRVENIMELVEILLKEKNGMNKESVQAIIDTEKTRNITLATKVPVILAYWTVEVKENDKLVFKPDIYLRDQKALAALNQQ